MSDRKPSGRSEFGFPVYSTDSHVVEPPDLWISRITSTFRDQAPRVVRMEDTELWVVDDNIRMAVVGIQAQAGRRYASGTEKDQITKRGFYHDIPDLGPDRYVLDLDSDGVAGAVLFPSNAHQAYRCIDGDLLAAVARTYNDWVLEFCATHPGRLKAVAMLDVGDVSAAIVEMERAVSGGAAGVLIPVLPRAGRRYDQPVYERLWSAAEAMNVPLLMHVGGNQAVLRREPTIDLIRHATKDLHVQASLASMTLSGVFARHPRIRIGAVEFGASWAVYLMQQLDRVHMNGSWQHGRFPSGELPSDHLRRNVFFSFQEDRPAIQWRHVIGTGNLMWGNDYPHAESTFPRSIEILTNDLRDVAEEDARRIVCDNAVETFDFEASCEVRTDSVLFTMNS
jgi:predicted TIM-barrel fold metal-dependent hydrolase